MNKTDPQSQLFINWAMEQIKSVDQFEELLDEAWDEMDTYYLMPLQKIKDNLKEKMRLGALEHGVPKTDPAIIKEELNKEYLDIIGWLLMKKYAERG